MMGARFQADKRGGAHGPGACLFQGHGFRMGAAARLGPAPAHDQTVVHHHTAHRRVGPDITQAAAGQGQGHA